MIWKNLASFTNLAKVSQILRNFAINFLRVRSKSFSDNTKFNNNNNNNNNNDNNNVVQKYSGNFWKEKIRASLRDTMLVLKKIFLFSHAH